MRQAGAAPTAKLFPPDARPVSIDRLIDQLQVHSVI